MHDSPSLLLDPESFSKLFSRTHLIVYRFIYGLHGGPVEEVEDLTCDTYLRAWKGRNRFSGNDKDALSWLFTIARHLVIDTHRRKKTHPDDALDNLDDANFNAMFLSTQHTPEELVASHEQYIHLWNSLRSLPTERREMLVLRYLLGWQVKQIAKHMNMEENTISVYIRRSIDQIRRDW